jgi:NTE family protein
VFLTRLKIVFLLLLTLTGCAAPRPNIFIPRKAPPIPPAPPPQVALVLGSGGTRAFAEIGVIRVLERNRIPIDLIVGTSSGSIVGVLYADQPNARHLQRTLATAQKSDLIDISALHILQGPITGNALQNFILTRARARDFRELKIRMIAVATDLKTGATIPLGSGPIAPAINASSAIPPYFRPVNLYGHTLIDGSITDPIPVDIAKIYQPKVVLAVNVAPDFLPYVPGNLISIYDRTYTINDAVFNNESAVGADVIIRPIISDEMGIFDASQKYAIIRAGEIAAEKVLPQICAVLSQHSIASACSHGPTPKPESAITAKKPSRLQKIENFLKKLERKRT